jgi:hypothetical protein
MELALSLYVTFIRHDSGSGAAQLLGLSVAVLFGIWVQSSLARYIGALWFFALAASFGWPLVRNFGAGSLLMTALLALTCLLCLACSSILLFSKNFARELRQLRDAQPTYKRILRKWAIGSLIVLTLAATAVDIYRLLS